MKSSTKRLIIGLLEPVMRTFGSSRSLVQIPALMIRRFVLLAVMAIGSLVILFTGLSLLLSGLMELSALLGSTWIFSLAVGFAVAIAGATGLVLALRREAWVRPVEDNRHPTGGQHPIEMALMVALEMLEERKAQKQAEEAADLAAEENLGQRPVRGTPPGETTAGRPSTETPWNVN